MPSSMHETLIEMFRVRPAMVPELLLGAFGMQIPAFEQVRLQPGDCTDLSPTEYRADAVVVLSAEDEPVLAVIIEIQLGRDGGKRWSWPVYVATLRARLHCPTALLVVCVDAAIAAWCAAPIELGPGWRGTPLVLGPDRVPVLDDVADAERFPELVVLSALAHGGQPDGVGVLDVLLKALAYIEKQQAFLYLEPSGQCGRSVTSRAGRLGGSVAELVYAAMPDAVRRYLEGLMSTSTNEHLSELAQWFVAQGEAKGEARGKAAGVLTVLDARGVEVPPDLRLRIGACRDLEQLDVWVRRAATAETVADLLGG